MMNAAPALPNAMAGSPMGAGGSPAAAPGAGAGNQAAAINALKGGYTLMLKILSAFPPGSEDANNMMKATQLISKIVGKQSDDSAVPAAIQQMALAAKGGAMKSAPPVGIQANTQPPAEKEPI